MFQNFTKLVQHYSLFLGAILAIFVFSSCGPKLYFVKSTPKQNDISISSDLKQFLDKNSNQPISVVLRTPLTSSMVTQEIQNSEFYNTLERKLMNAGFAVRDRALLEKLIMNEQLSYESIAQKVRVDFIIEVVENSRLDNIQTKMFRKKDNKVVYITPKHTNVNFHTLNIITNKFTFRIVIAETGASCGFFTYHYIPCTNGCDIYAYKNTGNYYFSDRKREAGTYRNTFNSSGRYWSIDDDFIINDLSNKIISILQGK